MSPHVDVRPQSSATLAAEEVAEAGVAAAVKRKLLGTTAAEALKTLTEAEGVTGIEPSATKAALVWVGLLGKAEATNFKVEANAVVTAEYKGTPLAADQIPVGTFLVQPGKKIKVTKTAGAVTSVYFSVQLMN